MSKWTKDQLIQLRTILCYIYPRENDRRRVATEAGLDVSMIDIEGKAVNSWFEILRHANFQTNGVDSVLKVAQAENEDNEVLQQFETNQDLIVDNQPKPVWKGPSNNRALEKLLGEESELVDISFLEEGLEKAKSVGIIRMPSGKGTGFLTKENILITNNHVLPNEIEAKYSTVQFNYQKALSGGLAKASQPYELLPNEFFRTSKEDDWTAVKVAGDPCEEWGFLELEPASVSKGDKVNIIQHPGGSPKQLSYTHNAIAYKDDKIMQYLTDTNKGSSGSPVFDKHWRVVALHHAGLDSDATIDFPRNQGILIDVIIKGLKDQ